MVALSCEATSFVFITDNITYEGSLVHVAEKLIFYWHTWPSESLRLPQRLLLLILSTRSPLLPLRPLVMPFTADCSRTNQSLVLLYLKIIVKRQGMLARLSFTLLDGLGNDRFQLALFPVFFFFYPMRIETGWISQRWGRIPLMKPTRWLRSRRWCRQGPTSGCEAVDVKSRVIKQDSHDTDNWRQTTDWIGGAELTVQVLEVLMM